MRIMQIIGRTDADIVNRLMLMTKLVDMPIETFKLPEKSCLGEVTVENSHRIVRIDGQTG